MTLVASLLLSTLPQVFPGNDITLPPPRPGTAVAPAARPLSERERFRRDLMEMQGPDHKVEAKLQEMAASYAPNALEPLMLEVARSARANEMVSLMPVVRRFAPASPRTVELIGNELLFQLLARPLADGTRPVVETMVLLKGPAAKQALMDCVRGRIAAARRHAAAALVPMLTPDDLPFALALTREQVLDLQLCGIELLRALPDDRSAQRLVELLSKEPVLAGAACGTLIAHGPAAVPTLQRVLAGPAIDRGFAYAGFALAQIADDEHADALPDSVGPALAARLGDPEPVTRVLVAVPLADLLFRGAPGLPPIDGAVVDALLEVVQPQVAVASLDLLRRPAEERLQRITGRLVAAAEPLPWRAWWQDQKDGFTAVRARVAVDAAAAPMAIVTLRNEQRHVRVLAEGLADVAPVQGATEVVVSTAQMQELIAALQTSGLHELAAAPGDSALPRARSLQIQVPSGRSQVAVPVGPNPRFDALAALVQQRLDAEVWQLFRNPQDEPDRGAFWRAERRWLDANPSPIDRGRRFARRAIQGWPALGPTLRARAIDQLFAHPERRQLLSEQDGEHALAMLASLPELQPLDLRLLELAAAVPGDRCWRTAVDLATRMKGGGRQAVRSVFAVLGPDAVLAALQDTNPLVRRAGIDEIMVVRDLRAAPRLIELLADADPEVQRGAAAACGHLQIPEAARKLVDLVAADNTLPSVRHECLKSLGHIGGELAFPVLQRSLMAKGMDDKEAAMRGLGELRDPRAAHVLADLMVVGHGKDLGSLARLYLLRQTGRYAIPALRSQLEIVQDPTIRDQVVLLLGAYHDAGAVPNLLDLLRKPQLAGQAAPLFEGTTGLVFVEGDDRSDVAERWYRAHRNQAQWQWLLEALRNADVGTSLRPEHFAPTAALAPVVELSRLLVEVKEPRLWALTGAVLREVAKEDFGVVTLQTGADVREGIAARYRLLVETARAAQGR